MAGNRRAFGWVSSDAGHAMFFEKGIHVICEPACVTRFERDFTGKDVAHLHKKFFCDCLIKPQPGRQLKENWAEFFAERSYLLMKFFQQRTGIL